jgi:hypothetical protein
MSTQITTAFVDQFGANVFHLAQQKGSRLKGLVRNESQNGESAFYDRIGKVAAVKKAGRHSSTPQLDTPHSRRMVTLEDYEWADLIDQQDKIKMLNDPASEYVMAAVWALGRSMDDEIISAALGSAYSGQKGTTTVAHPNSQKYAANDASVTSNLNVRTLRAVKRKFDEAEVDPSEPRYLVCSASQIEALLGQTEVTSSDFATVKALVQGEVNTFMGFEFIRSERLSTQVSALSGSGTTGAVGSGTSLVGYRKCFAWSKMGLLLAIGKDIVSKIDERNDKSYATQAYACMSIGATRMEEEKVVEILCKES